MHKMRSWGNEERRVWGRLREAGCGVPASLSLGASRRMASFIPVRVSNGGGWLCYFPPMPFVYWVRIVSDTF